MTNILSLPDIEIKVLTGSNEHWIDTLAFLDEIGNPVSIAGIAFRMEVRHRVEDHEVVLVATTENGRLLIEGEDDSVLEIFIPHDIMTFVGPGEFVTDIVASADGHVMKIIDGQPVTIFHGVTRDG